MKFFALAATAVAARHHHHHGYHTFDDDVVLQVNGVPVLVNPESTLMNNQMAAAGLGLDITTGPDDLSLLQGAPSKDLDDVDMKRSIRKFNQKLAQLNKELSSHTLLGLMTAPEHINID